MIPIDRSKKVKIRKPLTEEERKKSELKDQEKQIQDLVKGVQPTPKRPKPKNFISPIKILVNGEEIKKSANKIQISNNVIREIKRIKGLK